MRVHTLEFYRTGTAVDLPGTIPVRSNEDSAHKSAWGLVSAVCMIINTYFYHQVLQWGALIYAPDQGLQNDINNECRTMYTFLIKLWVSENCQVV